MLTFASTFVILSYIYNEEIPNQRRRKPRCPLLLLILKEQVPYYLEPFAQIFHYISFGNNVQPEGPCLTDIDSTASSFKVEPLGGRRS